MWLLAVLLLILIVFGLMYNQLVRLRETGDGAWADIDVQLKRRHDLIPNLVETVKGYASHEQETLERVISARSRAMSAEGPAERSQAEGMLTQALKSLFALSESYPQLRAVESFSDLQGTLADIEDSIQNARRYYNAVVRDYNTKIHSVPSNVVAQAFGFKEREFFEIEEGERAVPRVSFDQGSPDSSPES